MRDLARHWRLGDEAMIGWDGSTAAAEYKVALAKCDELKQLKPSEGYAGRKIELQPDAAKELQACETRAEEEIRRKKSFERQVRKGEDFLEKSRAQDALKEFVAAKDVSAHRREYDIVNSGIARADRESRRQHAAKAPVIQAMDLIARCNPSKWTDSETRPQPEEWLQAAEWAQAATDLCTEGLGHMESTEDGMISQQGTKEHDALAHLREACDLWKQAAELMAKWSGKPAKELFTRARGEAHRAREAGSTVGYVGAPCCLTEAADSALESSIVSATKEIGRVANADANESTARQDMARGAAGSAKEAYTQLLAEAETDEKKDKFGQLLKHAQDEEARQLSVYELHKQGIRALGKNDPESALELYEQALIKEPGSSLENGSGLMQTSTGRDKKRLTEPDSLQEMQKICSYWIEGNAAVLEWDGTAAVAAFENCAEHAQLADNIRKTPGYAGAKICLGQSTPALETCLDRAQEEKRRNEEFKRLVALGEAELLVWKAEEAHRHFTDADRLVDFILTFDIGDKLMTRDNNVTERDQTRDCVARAELEIDRQQQVKEMCKSCVRTLAQNTDTPGIERRDAAKVT